MSGTGNAALMSRRAVAAGPPSVSNVAALPTFGTTVSELLHLADRGLPKMFRADSHEFAFTRRGLRHAGHDTTTRLEGSSVRYGAIGALGARYLPIDRQRAIFGGDSVDEFCARLASKIGSFADLGEVALVAWLAAELGHPTAPAAFDVLVKRFTPAAAAATVETAWALSAAVAFVDQVTDDAIVSLLVNRLLSSRGGDGVLFPHNVAPSSQPWFRSRVGCFADQVYPIQALARHFRRTQSLESISAANACAKRICELQGPAGQWWWHYDWQRGDVIEGYPVYSVHQHAMAPMALLDLAECGGIDMSPAIRAGVEWLTNVPETSTQLIDTSLDVIWRKVARHEPRPKLVRAARAAARPAGASGALRWLDLVARPGKVDYECRPYELGWLLYAWLHNIEPLGDASTASEVES